MRTGGRGRGGGGIAGHFRQRDERAGDGDHQGQLASPCRVPPSQVAGPLAVLRAGGLSLPGGEREQRVLLAWNRRSA